MTDAERLEHIRRRLAATTDVTYVSEWLGYLPYGVYRWLEVDGRDVTDGMPDGWRLEDLARLEREGFLERTGEERDPKDEHSLRIRFRVR